jgi:hypothetical protein
MALRKARRPAAISVAGARRQLALFGIASPPLSGGALASDGRKMAAWR